MEDRIVPVEQQLLNIKSQTCQCQKGCWHFRIKIRDRWLTCEDEFASQEEADRAFSEMWPGSIYYAEGSA